MYGFAESGRQSVSELLLPVAGAPRLARDVVTLACLGWHLPHLAPVAVLLASELVTNAVLHAGTLIDLVVARGTSEITIVVGDGSPAPAVVRRPPETTGPGPISGGRGLLIVEAMASRWGCHRVEGGKVVWASVRLERSSGWAT